MHSHRLGMSCNGVSSSHIPLPRALTLLPYLLNGGPQSIEVFSPGKGADLVYLKVAWKWKEKRGFKASLGGSAFSRVSSAGNCVSLSIRTERT